MFETLRTHAVKAAHETRHKLRFLNLVHHLGKLTLETESEPLHPLSQEFIDRYEAGHKRASRRHHVSRSSVWKVVEKLQPEDDVDQVIKEVSNYFDRPLRSLQHAQGMTRRRSLTTKPTEFSTQPLLFKVTLLETEQHRGRLVIPSASKPDTYNLIIRTPEPYAALAICGLQQGEQTLPVTLQYVQMHPSQQQ